jgi:deazaflavin-dependent oxidoreductase (nitroreductase family)
MSPYVTKPGHGTRRLNAVVMWLSRRGLDVQGARILSVRGRTSGAWRQAPVNPLDLGSRTYLVAPRGHVQWTHNLRAAGGGTLRRGRTTRPFTAVEVPDTDKPAILRAYRARWNGQVGRFFREAGVSPDATDAQWLAKAGDFPVFRIAFTA